MHEPRQKGPKGTCFFCSWRSSVIGLFQTVRLFSVCSLPSLIIAMMQEDTNVEVQGTGTGQDKVADMPFRNGNTSLSSGFYSNTLFNVQ
jgi:hypothetical protein